MIIVTVLCGLAIIFAYEIRYRVVTEHLAQLDNEAHALRQEIKKLNEEVKILNDEAAKRKEAETKKPFKLPFFP